MAPVGPVHNSSSIDCRAALSNVGDSTKAGVEDIILHGKTAIPELVEEDVAISSTYLSADCVLLKAKKASTTHLALCCSRS